MTCVRVLLGKKKRVSVCLYVNRVLGNRSCP